MIKVLTGYLLALTGLCLICYPIFCEINVRREQILLRQAHAVNHGEPSPGQGPETYDGQTKSLGMAHLEIPSIDLSVLVAPGTSPARLKKSPGWYEDSALPGRGNTCIAAHRTTYGAWFRHLNRLKEGDLIILDWSGGLYRYRVTRVGLVGHDNRDMLRPTEASLLTLTTCQGSRDRLIVRAEMMDNPASRDNH